MISNKRSSPYALAVLGFVLFASGQLFAAEQSMTGYSEPYRIITVSAAESGVLKEVLVREGERVKAQQILARLETDTLQAELDVADAEMHLQTTRKERIAQLAAEKRAAPEEVDRVRTDCEIKEAQIRRIKSQIENRILRSPVEGVVTEIKRDPSESVSSSNPHVITVVQIDRLVVNLYLPPARVQSLKEGSSAELLFTETKQPVKATIDFISPITDPASGTVRVKFVIENQAGTYRSGAPCTLP